MRQQLILATVLLIPAFGQTRLDVGKQTRNIDFSNSDMVRPFRTGATLPATCTAGEMFFKTLAPAGSNVYGCVAVNTWALQGGGATTPFQPSRTDSTNLALGADCSVSTPCRIRIGGTTYSFTEASAVTISSGSGLVRFFINSSGVLTAGTAVQGSPSLTCTGCSVVSPVTQFPADSIPIALWNASLGAWDETGADQRALLSGGRTFAAGANIVITESGNEVRIRFGRDNAQFGQLQN